MKVKRTTKMYDIRVLRKIVLQMKIDNFVRIMICFVIFSWIFCTCESHFNRVSICMSRTRISIFDWIVFESILIVIVMSNFVEFWIKWISSYLIKTNTNSCQITHRSQSLCIFSKFWQFSSMFFSLIKMLTLSTYSRNFVFISNLLHIFNKSTL
jgi:hypothetical protein